MTDIFWNGKLLESLVIFESGEDGQDFFLRGTTKDGKKFETGTAKGSC